ncbi:MAG: hypothetical protein Q4B67_00110 [Eubacteriales bacterium]|nr:hypothetical protein [Eubacteriales bacterium]
MRNKETVKLKKSFYTALMVLLIAFLSMVSVTYAWYVFNTKGHTTNVKMAAGSSTKLRIGKENGEFGFSTEMETFEGKLLPVSCADIDSGEGFQMVTEFEHMPDMSMLASKFGKLTGTKQYYHTKLQLKTNAQSLDIYVKLKYTDEETASDKMISKALRVGLVMDGQESIFELNKEKGANRNTTKNPTGMKEPFVIDKNGNLVSMEGKLLSEDNYCDYDESTGKVTLKDNSKKIGTLSGGDGEDYGPAETVDVYVWLEGCDLDCTDELVDTTLKDLTIIFAGVEATIG